MPPSNPTSDEAAKLEAGLRLINERHSAALAVVEAARPILHWRSQNVEVHVNLEDALRAFDQATKAPEAPQSATGGLEPTLENLTAVRDALNLKARASDWLASLKDEPEPEAATGGVEQPECEFCGAPIPEGTRREGCPEICPACIDKRVGEPGGLEPCGLMHVRCGNCGQYVEAPQGSHKCVEPEPEGAVETADEFYNRLACLHMSSHVSRRDCVDRVRERDAAIASAAEQRGYERGVKAAGKLCEEMAYDYQGQTDINAVTAAFECSEAVMALLNPTKGAKLWPLPAKPKR